MAELDLGLVVGPGVPSGGTAGQVLKKKSAADYDTEWAASGTADALPLAGGTMSGNINMDGNKVTNLPTPSANADAVPKSYADDLLTGYRTAAAQDVIDAAQDTDIASRAKADEIGIVITGARPSMVVSAGQYVIIRGSTISGVTDGLYTAVNALSPSTDVAAADLSSVSEGGLNNLSQSIPQFGLSNIVYSYSIAANTQGNTNLKTLIDADLPAGKRFLCINGFTSNSSKVMPSSVRYSDSNYSLAFFNTGSSTASAEFKVYYVYY